jgi:hypothetical protein
MTDGAAPPLAVGDRVMHPESGWAGEVVAIVGKVAHLRLDWRLGTVRVQLRDLVRERRADVAPEK